MCRWCAASDRLHRWSDHLLGQLSRSDPLGGASIGLGDVVLNIAGSNTPDVPAPDLDPTEFAGLQQRPNLAHGDVKVLRRPAQRLRTGTSWLHQTSVHRRAVQVPRQGKTSTQGTWRAVLMYRSS